MNELIIDYNVGKVEFIIDDKSIFIDDFREENNDLISYGFEYYLDPLKQSCYACDVIFEGYVFYAKIIYINKFLKIINFTITGKNIGEYNEWDYEGGYQGLKDIFDKTSFLNRIEDNSKSYIEYKYVWGVIAVYYSRVGLDVNFSIRWNN